MSNANDFEVWRQNRTPRGAIGIIDHKIQYQTSRKEWLQQDFREKTIESGEI